MNKRHFFVFWVIVIRSVNVEIGDTPRFIRAFETEKNIDRDHESIR